MTLLKEIVTPYQPALSLGEAELLLNSHNGNVILNATIPLSGIAELTSGTVWSYLLEQKWGEHGETLQNVIDQYDGPQEWGPEIKEDPRVKFVERLKKHTPLQAVALQFTISEWWNARGAADDKVDARNTLHLALTRFFNIRG